MSNRESLILLVLSIALGIIFMLDLLIGSVSIPIMEILEILSGGETENSAWKTIITEFRLPKAITAVVAGSGLATCGLLMQTLFRNPLAGPFVLGISSGASLGVALIILAGSVMQIAFAQLPFIGSWTTVIAAILGSLGVFVLIMIISITVRDSMTLLIIGLMVGSLSGALVSVLQFYSQAQEIQSFLIWTFGNLGGVHGSELWVLTITVLIGLLGGWMVCKPLNALLIGESYARSMGVDVRRMRLLVIAVASILAGGITAFCGPLAFVGIATPHLARMLLKSANHLVLVPGCFVLGALVMLLCDVISQLPGSSNTLPINAITSLIGAPAVIAILIKSRNLSKSFA